MKTIKDFIEHCGGTRQIAVDLDLHQITIEGWKRRGIPWHLALPIRDKYGVGIDAISKINASVKGFKNGRQ